MNPEPLLTAEQPIPLHAFAAFAALGLAVPQFVLRKGTRLHRVFGWAFVGAMAVTAISALWIHTIRLVGPFSPIHLVIPYTLYSLLSGVRAARSGRVAAHRQTMIWLTITALVITGAFTLIPGRVMHAVLFG